MVFLQYPTLILEDEEYTAYTKQAANVEIVLRNFIIPEGLHILDVGCGSGDRTFKAISATNASKMVGIDPDKDKVMRARETYAAYPKLEFWEKRIEDLFEQEIYDASTCFATLHWLSEESQKIAFKNVSKALKPGGIFIATFFTTSNKVRLNTAIQEVRIQEKWQESFREYIDPIHVPEPTVIKGLLTSCGFKIQNFEHDETTREFKNDDEFHKWINTWSTYGKFFNEKSQHDEFWWDVIHLYRKLTNQNIEDEKKLLLTEYNLRLYAIKK